MPCTKALPFVKVLLFLEVLGLSLTAEVRTAAQGCTGSVRVGATTIWLQDDSMQPGL